MEGPSFTAPDGGDREITQARHLVERGRDADANLRRKLPLSQLTDEHKQVIELMVYGLDEGGTIEDEHIPAHQPLTLRQAARAVGVSMRHSREVHETPLFQTELNRAIAARRNSERPKNLTTAITIRDDPGDNTAADRTVRLKAIRSIEERDGAAGVTMTVNNSNNQTHISPGYVIRLRPKDQQRPGDSAKVIDASSSEARAQESARDD